ncbi:hypothetical protein [Halocalculus aciditolerans]|uniref:Uncharacterized protein n=1 Tax=Halocalculus aciditolerans TaxID=1383812 RepID=A0A830FNP0_9EURY|nr:hypothetical protein [Halocalculus aciditolerans]GGL73751.1 hypothetical protein GCM10009039_34850 [Halocalculus aciditolerans]
MVDLPESHGKVLQDHITEGESIATVEYDGETTTAVSGRRLYQVEVDDAGVESVTAIGLDAVTRIDTERHPDEEQDAAGVIVGSVLSVAGLALAGFGLTQSSVKILLFVIGGILAITIGLVILATALDTEDGHAEIEVTTGTDEWELEVGLNSDLPETVSERVSRRAVPIDTVE